MRERKNKVKAQEIITRELKRNEKMFEFSAKAIPIAKEATIRSFIDFTPSEEMKKKITNCSSFYLYSEISDAFKMAGWYFSNYGEDPNYELSKNYFRKAFEINPRNTDLELFFYYSDFVLRVEKDIPKAKLYLEKAIFGKEKSIKMLSVNQLQLYANLMHNTNQMDEFNSFISAYEKKYSQEHLNLQNLAYIYSRLKGDYQKSEYFTIKALILNPGDPFSTLQV